MKLRCIIVDDEPISRDILRTYIKDVPDLMLLGECRDALEANAILISQSVDLVFLDINMPRMNGIEFLRFVRNDSDFKKLPVVILTTSTEEQDKIESFELGISGYMVKPVDYDEFVEMIQVVIKYWRLSEFPQED